MKSLNKILIALMLAFGLGFVVYLIEYVEFSFATLKCEEKKILIGEGEEEIFYYRLTKKILDDRPIRLYSSNPNFDEAGNKPFLSGVSLDSTLGDTINVERREHFYPNWYSFAQPPRIKDSKVPTLGLVTYINRENLAIETRFSGDGAIWSSGSCGIVKDQEFENDWLSKLNLQKERSKI